MSRTLRLGLCAATLLAAAVPAGAQHVERLRPGRVQADSLRATDLATAAWGYVRLYRLDALPGRTYVLALRSADFDARLLVARGVGPLTDVVASDDDGGGGTDARLRFRPTQTGPFLVLVSAVPRDTARPTGGFRLAVHEVSERSLNPDRLALGDSVRGELNDRSAAWGATRVIGEGELEAPRPDLPVDVYDFRAHRGPC